MNVTKHVEGLAELDKMLGQLPEATAKNVLRRVGRVALEVFDEEWRRNAPFETGALQDSGGVGSNLTRSQREANDRENYVEVFAGPGPHPQAVQQEFGNEHHPPDPFARPAWEATKDQVLDRVANGLGEEINKATRRYAKKVAKARADSIAEAADL